MSTDPLAEWHQVLDMYEVEDAEYLTDLHTWYPELIRELLQCRGIEQIRPFTSHMHLHLALHPNRSFGPRGEIGCVSIDLDRGTREYVVFWRRTSGQEESRRCPHLKSVVRAVRVAARQCGVKISQPPRVQPEVNSLRRVWVVFPGGRFL